MQLHQAQCAPGSLAKVPPDPRDGGAGPGRPVHSLPLPPRLLLPVIAQWSLAPGERLQRRAGRAFLGERRFKPGFERRGGLDQRQQAGSVANGDRDGRADSQPWPQPSYALDSVRAPGVRLSRLVRCSQPLPALDPGFPGAGQKGGARSSRPEAPCGRTCPSNGLTRRVPAESAARCCSQGPGLAGGGVLSPGPVN